MPKVKKQSVRQVQEKARTARAYSGSKLKGAGNLGGPEAEYVLQETAMNLSRGKPKKFLDKLGRGFSYPTKAESKAALLMQNTRAAELERSARRAASVTKRAKAKAEKAKTTRALTGNGKKAKKK
jgi:hypothetical protein